MPTPFRSLLCASVLTLGLSHAGMQAFLPLDPQIAPVDLTGDGREELILQNREFYLWRAFNIEGEKIISDFEFGSGDATPLAGRFLEEGKATLSYYSSITGEWVVLVSDWAEDEVETTTHAVTRFGIPLVADFTGDGLDELALFDPEHSHWDIWDHKGNTVMEGLSFGKQEWHWAAGDVTGDGRAELISYEQETGRWSWLSLSDETVSEQTSTPARGRMIVRDFNGDGKADLGLYDYEGTLVVLAAATGESLDVGPAFGDEYTIPVHGRYEGRPEVNPAYITMGHGIWNVKKSDGSVVRPALR